MGIIYILIGLIVCSLIKEENNDEGRMKICKVLFRLRDHLKNWNFLKFLLFLFFAQAGYSPISSVLMARLQKEGMEKEIIVMFDTINTIISNFLALYIANRILEYGREQKYRELTFI